MNAGIGITGTNAEVALGQWEFQVLGLVLVQAMIYGWHVTFYNVLQRSKVCIY